MSREVRQENIGSKYSFSAMFKDLWEYAKDYRGQVIYYFIITIFLSLISLLPTYLYGRIIDDLTNSRYALIYIFLACIAVTQIIFYSLKNYIIYKTKILAARIRNATRIKIFDHLFGLDYEYYETNSLGQTFSRIEIGSQAVREVVKSSYSSTLIQFFGILFSIISLLIIDYRIGIFAAVILIIYYWYGFRTSHKLIELDNNINKESEKVYSKVYDFFSHIKLVKLLNIKNKLLALLDKSSEDVITSEKISRSYERFVVAVNSLLRELSVVGLLAYLAYSVIHSELSVGMAIMTFGFFTKCMGYAEGILDAYFELLSYRTGMYRIALLNEIKPTLKEPTNPKDVYDWQDIRFENISFKYPSKNIESLNNITFKISRREKIAVVGLSGSGKSTITKLLLKLYRPKDGKIYVGNAEINEIKSLDLYGLIRIVPQDNELMNASILDNLKMTVDREISNEEVIESLKKANAWEFIEKLPQGIDTIVGPDGIKISGGEKQRICIARALLTNPQILLLDEATSNLDVISERKIYDNLMSSKSDTTIIAITHRISSLGVFERIIVLDNGRIVGCGKHKQLLKNKYYLALKNANKKNLNKHVLSQ